MDDGTLVGIGGGWNLPPSYPNYCATWMEITGTDGSLFLDDTQRDNWLNTVSEGTRFPMSTMPGEHVDHVFAGQMGPEKGAGGLRDPFRAPPLPAGRGEPIALPMTNQALSGVQDLYKKFRTPV